MSNITNDLSKELTEKILQGIPSILTTNIFQDPQGIQATPTYMFPVKNKPPYMKGLSVTDQKLANFKAGFQFNGTKRQLYFQIGTNGNLIHMLKDDITLYLPLQKTDSRFSLTLNDPFNNYQVLGIKGEEGIFPILYFLKLGEDIIYHTLLHDGKESIKDYSFRIDSEFDLNTKKLVKKMFEGEVTRSTIHQRGIEEYPLSGKNQKNRTDISNWQNQLEPEKGEYLN